MANTKRKLANSAGQPTMSVRAERTAQSLADERGALRRRIILIGVPGLVLMLLVGGLLYSCGSQPASSSSSAAEASTTAAPAVQATPVPAVQPIATAAPVAANTQPTNGALTSGGIICPDIAGLPIYTNATCIAHDSDQDDGVTKNENTYLTTASVDEVRRFFEGAFTQNGWTVAESKHDAEDNSWSYSITQAQRRLKVEIEPTQGTNGTVTRMTIAEK